MKQLNKIQTSIFILGGVLMVIGAGCFAFGYMIYPQLTLYTSWLFLLGTVAFSVMPDSTKKMSGISMVDTVYAFARNWFSNYETYITYFYNKWVVFLLVAALIELYTTHRISHELKKEECK